MNAWEVRRLTLEGYGTRPMVASEETKQWLRESLITSEAMAEQELETLAAIVDIALVSHPETRRRLEHMLKITEAIEAVNARLTELSRRLG